MWLDIQTAKNLVARFGTPLYVYDQKGLEKRADELLGLSAPYGLTVRYAVKANPHKQIIKIFNNKGLHFDASSSYEAALLLKEGVEGHRISLSSQQPAHNLEKLLAAGVLYVATSMRQLELFANASSGGRVALRVNVGVGSGHSNQTTTGGPSASFGLWHEYLDDALAYARKHGVVIDRLHLHIGTGSDPKKWGKALQVALDLVERMPEVTTLDMGGGYKIRRFGDDQETDMQKIAQVANKQLLDFYQKTSRKLHLEIEPGGWLVGHAGVLITKIVDITDTGKNGFTFLRTDTGMNDFLRPTLHGAQHEMHVLNEAKEQMEYVVVGHNCEGSDMLTPAKGHPETIEPRRLNKAHVGDLLLIEDTGAYCAAMRTAGYNSYPGAPETFI